MIRSRVLAGAAKSCMLLRLCIILNIISPRAQFWGLVCCSGPGLAALVPGLKPRISALKEERYPEVTTHAGLPYCLHEQSTVIQLNI